MASFCEARASKPSECLLAQHRTLAQKQMMPPVYSTHQLILLQIPASVLATPALYTTLSHSIFTCLPLLLPPVIMSDLSKRPTFQVIKLRLRSGTYVLVSEHTAYDSQLGLQSTESLKVFFPLYHGGMGGGLFFAY